MLYEKGFVYTLMDAGGPTDVREPYFQEAVDEMMRSRTFCAQANARLPSDPAVVADLEELFGRSLDDVRILTPFICDFGNRVTFGKNVFINHSAILSASGGIVFEDGVSVAPGCRIATINHDFNERHTKYTYGKVTIKK
ncbi:MAG: sugar O-acetyltransferase, partial [Treponemataceae bacterium]|nr:sugar O-acetyltransferase [Treponemataceae bacterium]